MKKLLIVVLLIPLYLNAADFDIGYAHFNLDLGDGYSTGLGSVTAAISTKSEDGFFSGEIGVYVPIGDEVVDGATITLKSAPFARGFIHLNENFFLSVGAVKLDAEACNQRTCLSDSETEGSFGFGASFPVAGTDSRLRIMYETVDDADVISVSTKFEF